MAYETAFLIRYYPTEYIAAMLNSVMGINEKVSYYIRFAKTLGIEVLPPDINESYTKFTVRGNRIRFGLAAIKNVGANVIESIVASRSRKGHFTSLTDLVNKVDMNYVNKRVVESLIKAGAMDSFSVHRSQMFAVYEQMLDGANNERKRNIEGQINLFQDFKTKELDMDIRYPNIKEFDKKHLLAMEKEMTGLYISGHPLDEYADALEMNTDTKISDIIVDTTLEDGLADSSIRVQDGDRVTIGGIITQVTKKVTKNNEMMAFAVLEDLYGSIEVIIFPKTFERCKALASEDSLVVVRGRISMKEDEPTKLLCESMEQLINVQYNKIYIRVKEEKDLGRALNIIKNLKGTYAGSCPVFLCTEKERKKMMLNRSIWLDGSENMRKTLTEYFGAENVK